jgi:uncharacterized protein YqjF (DUF2071 family)
MSTANDGSVDEWLLERYRLYVAKSERCLLSATVEHPAWVAAPAVLERVSDSLDIARELDMAPRPALAHFSPGVAARFASFSAVTPFAAEGRGNAPIAGRRRQLAAR